MSPNELEATELILKIVKDSSILLQTDAHFSAHWMHKKLPCSNTPFRGTMI